MRKTRHFIEYASETEDLARFAKALSHPTRILMLQYLKDRSCCFTGDLVDVFPLAQSTISQHLKELKTAGLIQGEVEPPKIRYCVHRENYRKARKLFETLFKERLHESIEQSYNLSSINPCATDPCKSADYVL
ncbi:MAG: winged helix-turn-helix transcriptional regulator [Bacteroidetes bacterium]|nr:winged helix-turn-helix transcriptional regulator [Bacteroidota bacterium]